jgi:cell division transport system permease protein
MSDFNRTMQFAFQDFNRNKGISLAAIFVLTVTVLLISSGFLFHGVANYVTGQIQNKIDITAYFKAGTQESDVQAAQVEIQKLSTVKGVQYVSQAQAMATFQQAHQNDVTLQQAITQVGENPFLPQLNISTNGDPTQYQQVANVLANSDFSNLIDHVDYSQKKAVIDQIYAITSRINRFGLVLAVLLVIMAILVVFNTVKLAIDNSKEEIATMRIVGASDWFIRGPFIICGAIYGLIAFGISFVISLLSAYGLSYYLAIVMPGFNLFTYLLTNILIFVLIQLLFGVGLGILSSYIVVRKYLKI